MDSCKLVLLLCHKLETVEHIKMSNKNNNTTAREEDFRASVSGDGTTACIRMNSRHAC